MEEVETRRLPQAMTGETTAIRDLIRCPGEPESTFSHDCLGCLEMSCDLRGGATAYLTSTSRRVRQVSTSSDAARSSDWRSTSESDERAAEDTMRPGSGS